MTNQFNGYVKKTFNDGEGGEEQESTDKIEYRKKKLELSLGIFLFLLVFVAILFLSPLILKISDQFGPNDGIRNGENLFFERKANLIKELKDNGLFQKLREASVYCDARGTDAENKALTLYREIIGELSPGVCRALNLTLLNEAENDFRKKHYVHALRKYRTLFDEVINDSGAELFSYRRQK